MTAKYYKTELIAKKLIVLFDKYISGEKPERSEKETELCKQLFSHNVLFLRTYLGFMVNGNPFDQMEFASLLGISAAGLRRWESADVVPNELSLRSVAQYANQVLNLPIRIENAHLLYSDLVTELTLLRMGSHTPAFKNLSKEQQRQFASFMSNNMDKLLDYFMDEAQETKINYQILLDNALVGIYVFNKDGKITYVNQTLCQMSGYSQEEIVKINFASLIHPDDLEETKRKIEKRISGKNPQEQYIHRIRNKNGEYRKYEVFSSRILLKGKPAILGVVQDITERSENERLLRESEEKFRVMASSALDAMIMINDKGNVTFWNAAAEHIFGYTSDEMLDKELHMIIAPEKYRKRYKDGIKQFLETGTGPVMGRILQFSGLHKDGTEFPVEISLSGVKLNDAWNAIGIIRDITERINAENAIKESEEKYRSLFASMSTAFALHEVITDKNGKPVDYRFLEVNNGFEMMTGLKAKDIIGKTVLEILPNTETVWIEKYGQIAMTGKPDHIIEYSRELGKYYEVHAYSPKKGQFAVTFIDVPDTKAVSQK